MDSFQGAKTGNFRQQGSGTGVIDSTNNFVEHPELIRQRIERFVSIVGADRVMAGSDCGFGTFAGFGSVDPDIVYEKLRSLAEGARRV